MFAAAMLFVCAAAIPASDFNNEMTQNTDEIVVLESAAWSLESDVAFSAPSSSSQQRHHYQHQQSQQSQHYQLQSQSQNYHQQQPITLTTFGAAGKHINWNIKTKAGINARLRIKATPSTLCDSSVTQISGYLDTENDKHFYFWFFESRDAPKTDPLVLWLNGGPGCSSLTVIKCRRFWGSFFNFFFASLQLGAVDGTWAMQGQ